MAMLDLAVDFAYPVPDS